MLLFRRRRLYWRRAESFFPFRREGCEVEWLPGLMRI
jgi:hypothetical protein